MTLPGKWIGFTWATVVWDVALLARLSVDQAFADLSPLIDPVALRLATMEPDLAVVAHHKPRRTFTFAASTFNRHTGDWSAVGRKTGGGDKRLTWRGRGKNVPDPLT
ncbi:MAG: hypothetical protein ACKO26_17315 [Planctomycetota bacterium]